LIDKATVLEVSRLASLDLEEDELKTYTSQLSRVLDYFTKLDQADVDNIEPAVYPIDIKGPLRNDEILDSIACAKIMNNTKHEKNGFYTVPRIIE